jgi:hypothetical protein
MPDYEVKDRKGRLHKVRLGKEPTDAERIEIESALNALPDEKPKPLSVGVAKPQIYDDGEGNRLRFYGGPKTLSGAEMEAGAGVVPGARMEGGGFRPGGAARQLSVKVGDAMYNVERLKPGSIRRMGSRDTALDVAAGFGDAAKRFVVGGGKALVNLLATGAGQVMSRDDSDEEGDRAARIDAFKPLVPMVDTLEAGLSPEPVPNFFQQKFQADPYGTALEGAMMALPGLHGRFGKAGATGRVAATERGMGAGARFASMLGKSRLSPEILAKVREDLVRGSLSPESLAALEGTIEGPVTPATIRKAIEEADLPAIEPVKASPFFTANRRAGRRSSVDLAKLEPLTDDPLANTLSSRIADETIGAPDPNVGNGLPRPTEIGKRSGGRISDQFANTPGGAVADWLETRLENIDPNLPNALTPEESLLAVREVGAYASGRIPRITKSTAMLLDRAVGSGWRETLADATKKVPKLRSNSVYSESLPYPPNVQPHIGEGAPVPTVALDSGRVSAMSSLLDESAPRRAMDSRSATPNELLRAIDGMEGISDATRTKLRRQLLKGQLTTEFYDTVDSHFGVGPNITRIAAPEGSAGLGSLISDELKAWDDLPDEVKWSMDEVPREGLTPPPFEGGGAPLMGENSRAARGGRGRPRLTSLEPKNGVDPKSARGRFEAIAKITNAPRDLMYGFELSAMGRQAAKLGLSNPKAYVSAVKSGFRALKSDELAAAERAAMGRSPYADLHKKHGLATSDAMAEEFRPSLIDDVKGLGPASKRFKEHFEVTIEKMRQETFDRQVDAWKKQGFKPQDRHFNELADYVNTMTGRGDLGILDPKKSKVKAIQNLSRVVDETMASPRLQASYLNAPRMLLDPRISKPVRVKAAREMGIHIASTAGLVALAKQAGFKVSEDPTDTNWGKIEVPGKNGAKTYVDLWGGYQPWARLVAQETLSKKNGKPIPNWNPDLSKPSRGGLLIKRGESTLAPTPSLLIDLVRGKDFTGQPVTPGEALAARAWPIAYQDVVAAIKAHGGAKGSALGGLVLLGVNVSTYEKRKKAGGD